jgi:outer membrane immunogenic protein
MMKRALVLSGAALAAVSSVAVAADLPPPIAPIYKTPPAMIANWTGCYIGGGGGGALMTTNQNTTGASANDNGGQGWFGVGGGGCDYQFHLLNWDLVVGAFGDYDFMNIRGTYSYNFAGLPTGLGNVKETSAWAGGARLGVVVAPNVLVYSTGGYTGTHFNGVSLTSVAGAPIAASLPSQNLNGWFTGAGTESSLSWVMNGLFLRTEYRFSDYQTSNTPFAGAGAAGVGLRSQTYTQSIFTELVWRFNATGARW